MAIFVLALCLSMQANAGCQHGENIAVQVLGSGGPEIDDGRASSSYLVWRNGHAVVMVDSGSGSVFNYEKSGASLNNLEAVLFTHFHVDHSVDFPTLIKASYFSDRDRDLFVYGPEGNDLMPSASAFVDTLLGEKGAFRYLDEYLLPERESRFKIRVTDVPLMPRQIHRYSLNEHIGLSAVPVQHGPVAAIAWRVDIDGCSMVFSGDMNNRYDTLAELARDADILVAHNAIPEGTTGVARFLHMPPSEIGRIAAKARVGRLVLSHRMNRTLGREQETREQIRRFYAGSIEFANDLDRFPLQGPAPQ